MSKTYTITSNGVQGYRYTSTNNTAIKTSNYTDTNSSRYFGRDSSARFAVRIDFSGNANMQHCLALYKANAASIASIKLTFGHTASSYDRSFYAGATLVDNGTKHAEGGTVSIPKSTTSDTLDITSFGISDKMAYTIGAISDTSQTRLTANASQTLTIVTNESDFKLTYNANGGSGAPAVETKTAYASATFTVSSTTPTRTGYKFLGWSKSSTATTASYSAGGTISITANTTLYAVWQALTYSVTYDANGGTGAPGAQTKTYGTALKLSTSQPTYTGKVFIEWNTSKDGSGTSYMPGASYTTNAALKLYAIWETITYSITYDATGGSGAPSTQTKNYNASVALSTAKPSKPGYVFESWNTSEYGSGTRYMPGDTYTDNADLSLYAQWDVAGVKVSFNPNGGVTPELERIVYPGLTYGTLPEPTWEKHTFLGWFTSATGGDEVTAQTIVTNGNDHTIFAHWAAEPSPGRHHAIAYIKDGGAMHQVRIYYKDDGTMKVVEPFGL